MKCGKLNYFLCRVTNLLWEHKNVEKFWEKVIETRENKSSLGLGVSSCQDGLTKHYPYVRVLVDALEDRLGFKAPKDVDKSVTNETINAAAEMFIYLTYCRKDSQAAWAQLYRNLFQNHNPDMILITLNRLMKTSQHDVAKELFEYLEIQWNLKFQSFATGGPNRMNIAIILRLINIYLSIVMQYPNPKRSIFVQ